MSENRAALRSDQEGIMALPTTVELVEVGPREGFQFEGVDQPHKISTDEKLRLIDALAQTGLRSIQIASFVNPKQTPQMADAELVCARVTPRAGVAFTGVVLNDVGLRRAIAANGLTIAGRLFLTASETFSLRNQKRTLHQDLAMQRAMAAIYRAHGYAIECGGVMAAFGCNYEGEIPVQRVLDLAAALQDIAAETGGALRTLILADTMGWADPGLVGRTVAAVRARWPRLRIGLHLHDTRGLGLANVYAGLCEGVDLFETAIGGLGGCPFAGHRGAAGNVATEEVAFLCRQLGIETGVDLEALARCARLASEIVGHPLPSKLATSSLAPRSAAHAAPA
jgi:hydroxymethylglutaryl-CoA lyase